MTAMLARAQLDIQIMMYRLWLAGRPCQHPRRALQKDGHHRTCRVCGHSFLTIREAA